MKKNGNRLLVSSFERVQLQERTSPLLNLTHFYLYLTFSAEEEEGVSPSSQYLPPHMHIRSTCVYVG